MNPPVSGKIQGLFKAFECFSSTIQGKFNFKDFSRQYCIFKYFSSMYLILSLAAHIACPGLTVHVILPLLWVLLH